MATFELEESSFSGYMADDTIVTAVVSSVKVQEKPYTDDDGQKVKKVVFKFAVDEVGHQHDSQEVYGETPTRFNNHPDCKLANWAREILASELPVGYRLDTDQLQGQRCRIVVGLREYQDKEGLTKQVNYVKDVMRSRDAMASAGAGAIEEPF